MKATGEDGDRDWISADLRHLWHPYTQALAAPPPIPVVRAEGVYLHTVDGRRILDGISSWWVNIHGHNHPRLNRALAAQAERLAQVIFAGFTHEPAARLAARLSALAPGDLRRVFLSDDGSTAVEVALKMAYQYWRNRGEWGRDLFVALEHAYHGDTFGAMAAGGVRVFHESFRDLLFDVRRTHSPTCQRCPVGMSRSTCRLDCADRLEEILSAEAGRIAAVIIEPMVQGAGGMLVWPAGFLRRVRELTDRYGTLLIADEVFTGFGRTGKLFACEHGPVGPDILCLSKALTGGYLPLAATLCREEIHDAFLGARGRAFLHGHSYTGNALACAVALESLDMLLEMIAEGRLERLERLFAERLRRMRGIPSVLDARGIGSIAAVEVRSREGGYLDELGPRLGAEFLRRDILLRPLGNVLYFLPPYAIDVDDAHRVFDAMEEVLGNLAPEG
jgi:adenosylmethionine-8-amino-7-oxononanoate aminotransferase